MQKVLKHCAEVEATSSHEPRCFTRKVTPTEEFELMQKTGFDGTPKDGNRIDFL